MKRYVIHEHRREGEDIHWDIMFEARGKLETYRLDKEPGQISESGCNAEKISDHELRFLNYEGPVNKGTGSVAIKDRGSFSVIEKKGGRKIISFSGEVLNGEFALISMGGDGYKFEALIQI